MSQIFDALQKSEAARAGTEAVVIAEPTDILRRMERSTVSQWDKEAKPTNEGTSRIEEFDALRAQAGIGPEISENIIASPFRSVQHEERIRILNQFQTLPFSVSHESRLVSVTDKDCPAAEAFRLLGVRLRDLGRRRSLRRILITSTTPQEGKTTVATNLAFTLARATQQKILLVEGDIRRPAISQMLGVRGQSGICEWLNGDLKVERCIYQLIDAGLWFLPAGSVPENPLEVLQSTKLNVLMAELVEWFDAIIIDSPPILPLADTSVWMRVADGVVLVTRQGTTEKKQLQQGLEAIEPQKLIGALLNCSKSPAHSHYYY